MVDFVVASHILILKDGHGFLMVCFFNPQMRTKIRKCGQVLRVSSVFARIKAFIIRSFKAYISFIYRSYTIISIISELLETAYGMNIAFNKDK